MKKIFSKLHLWLSLPFGLIISILCLTGAFLVFEAELLQLTNPSLYYVEEVKDKPIPLEELLPAVQKQLPDSVLISGVTFSPNPEDNYRMSMAGQRRISLTVDPYTAEVRGKIVPYAPNAFFSFVRKLHRWFMFPMKREGTNWGKIITGTSTLMFVFVLISGLIIWIPKTGRMLKRRLSIKLGAGPFRFLYDLHIAGGTYALIFLLTMSLTGLTWSFPWYRAGFYKVFGVEMTQGGGHGTQQSTTPNVKKEENSQREEAAGNERGENVPEGRRNRENREGQTERPEGRGSRENHSSNRGEQSGRPEGERQGNREGREGRSGRGENRGREEERKKETNFAVWEKVYTQLANQYPGYKTISVQDGTASVAFQHTGNSRASDRYSFDPENGNLTPTQLYKDTPKSGKIQGWIYAVHVGTWGGLFTRILYLIACLIGGCLPLTGYYIYYKKWIVKRRKNKY